jgi:hypothetical protein
MDWISSTHLADLASLDPSAAMVGLVVWTRSGGAPHQTNGPRFPVNIGSRSEIAARLGVSAPTVKRHWQSFESAFVEVHPGRFTPSLEHWSDPFETGPTDSQGRPLYVRIDPSCVDALTSLSRHAGAKTAWAAFRLALRLLPRLRAAAHRGHASVDSHQGSRSPGEARDYPHRGGEVSKDLHIPRASVAGANPEIHRLSTACGKPHPPGGQIRTDRAIKSGPIS